MEHSDGRLRSRGHLALSINVKYFDRQTARGYESADPEEKRKMQAPMVV